MFDAGDAFFELVAVSTGLAEQQAAEDGAERELNALDFVDEGNAAELVLGESRDVLTNEDDATEADKAVGTEQEQHEQESGREQKLHTAFLEGDGLGEGGPHAIFRLSRAERREHPVIPPIVGPKLQGRE